ncbi:MAG: DEAD/DEAH box helicase [Lentisphaeria bacterium]|nr:DEAD/DEAH box helicase [Lentisphaeria bacterium]
MTFAELNLSERILEALSRKNFTEPTPIQAKIIPLLLEGKSDLIGQARTGTGKTAAFGIPLAERVVLAAKKTGALVLTPTRELGMQVAKELEEIASGSGLAVVPVYGGQAIELQLRLLKKRCDIVVGTPGRVLDHIRRGSLKLDSLQYLILDEADEMLDMGFIDDIRAVLEATPPERKMLMFSATMPDEIRKIADDFMPECELIKVDAENSPANQVEHLSYMVKRENKVDALMRILALYPDFYGLVFCRTRTDADDLAEKLNTARYNVEVLHGEVSQAQRTRVIERFKKRGFNLLVATDVAARGIDISDLTHVVNYSIPGTPESFIHRAGRTGRAGKTGCAITFFTPGERRRYENLIREAKCEVRLSELPGAEVLANVRREALVNRLADRMNRREIPESYYNFAKELAAGDPVPIIAAMLAEIGGNEFDPESYGEPEKANKNKNFVKLVYAKGKADGVTARELLIEISEKSGLPLRRFGKIACYAHCTRIEAPEGNLRQILRAFNSGKEELLRIDDGTEEKRDAAPKREHRKSERRENADRAPAAPKAKRKLRDMFSEWENEVNSAADTQAPERRKRPRRG